MMMVMMLECHRSVGGLVRQTCRCGAELITVRFQVVDWGVIMGCTCWVGRRVSRRRRDVVSCCSK